MSHNSLTHDLESREFLAELALASTLPLFVRFAEQQDAFIALQTRLEQEPSARQVLFERAVFLSKQTPAQGAHPQDALLAVVLILLQPYTTLAVDLAHRLTGAPGYFWAKRIAHAVLEAASPKPQPSQNLYQASS